MDFAPISRQDYPWWHMEGSVRISQQGNPDEALIQLMPIEIFLLRWFFNEGTILSFVGFEVLTAVTIKSTVFRSVRAFSPVDVHGRFGGKYYLHVQSCRVSK
jgi:hypothetical protein